MTKRTLSVAILVCAGMCLAAWAQEGTRVPKRAKPAAPEATTAAPRPTTKPKPAPEPGPEEKALRAEAAGLIADYNAKKAEAFAQHFTPDAEYELGSGAVLAGRQAIQEHFAQVFEQHPQAQVESKNGRVRILSPHAATVEGVASLRTSGEKKSGNGTNPEAKLEGTAVLDGGEAEVRHVSTWVLQDGHWLISSLREVAGPAPAVSPHQRLEALA
ncbi:MAG TPA: SgcJ/EcaC family oxidoreductase, partial [Planctomycetaceae bacterium]|nr:SgcJ/EcaC family oxidoreductase [Planctomycetaceae bacterium]